MLNRLQSDAKVYAEMENNGSAYKMQKFLKSDLAQYLQNPTMLKSAIEMVQKLQTTLATAMQKETQYLKKIFCMTITYYNNNITIKWRFSRSIRSPLRVMVFCFL